MSKPRYASNCPYDVDGTEDYCYLNTGKYLRDCGYCKFGQEKIIVGDTKEQLINKVAQAITRKLKGGLILKNIKINETYNIQKTISAKVVAKAIVKFLGVEE